MIQVTSLIPPHKSMIIDEADAPLLVGLNWYVDVHGYAVAYVPLKRRDEIGFKFIKIHRLIMNAPKGLVVDHINHNRLDNRRVNMRLCTITQNLQNADGVICTNTSGFRGVMKHTQCNSWCAEIRVGGKRITRWFSTKEEAIKARREMELAHLGEYAPKESTAI